MAEAASNEPVRSSAVRKPRARSWKKGMQIRFGFAIGYTTVTLLQLVYMAFVLKLIDLVAHTFGTGPLPQTVVGVLFFALSIRSRVFCLLPASRPKLDSAEFAGTRAGRPVKRPWWCPPGLFFPIVWMGIAVLRSIAASTIIAASGGRFCNRAILAFALHLAAGDTWNHINNVRKELGTSAFGVWFVLASLLNCLRQYHNVDPSAAMVLAPSALWIFIACILTVRIWQLNPEDDGHPSTMFPPWNAGLFGGVPEAEAELPAASPPPAAKFVPAYSNGRRQHHRVVMRAGVGEGHAHPTDPRHQRRAFLAGVGGAVTAALLPKRAAADGKRLVGEFDTSGLVFKDKLMVEGIDDPKIDGVTIYLSDFQKSLDDRLSGGFFNDPSSSGLACVASPNARVKADLSRTGKEGEEVLSESKSLLFKSLKVRRLWDGDDKQGNAVYVSYPVKLNKKDDPNGSRYKTAACAVHVGAPPAP